MAMTPEARKATENGERSPIEERSSAKPRAVFDQTGQVVREVGGRAAETVAHGTPQTTETIQHTASQAQEEIAWGLRAVTALQNPLIEAGLAQAHRMADSAARIAAAYREAGERTAEDMQAILSSGAALARGVQECQRAWLDLAQQGTERMLRQRQTMLHTVGTPIAFAEAQRDFCVEMVKGLFTAQTTLLQLAGQIAQDAAEPLQARVRASA